MRYSPWLSEVSAAGAPHSSSGVPFPHSLSEVVDPHSLSEVVAPHSSSGVVAPHSSSEVERLPEIWVLWVSEEMEPWF